MPRFFQRPLRSYPCSFTPEFTSYYLLMLVSSRDISIQFNMSQGLLFYILQVECELFPLMRNQRLLLSSVNVEEALVQDYLHQAVDIFKANFVGPQKYLTLYRKYADLLNGKADQEVTAFLSEPHSIEAFKQVLTHLS
jgi:hypothetical protein